MPPRTHLALNFPAIKIVLTYKGIIGDGKVKYKLVVSSTKSSFALPSIIHTTRLARRYHLEGYEECSTRTTVVAHLVHVSEISFMIFAATKREDRYAFLGALGGATRIIH